MIGVMHQIIVALGLGTYHHSDYEATIPAGVTVGFSISPPSGFYGMVIHAARYGDVLSNALRATLTHYGYWTSTKMVHTGILDVTLQPWVWIEPNSPAYIELTNTLLIPAYYQQTVFELYFPTKTHMDLAKLAFWEYFAPRVYEEAVGRGVVPAILGIRKLKGVA